MFDNLREKWRKGREAKAFRQRVYNAIEGRNPEAVKEALDGGKDIALSDQERGWFLKRAIEYQNLEVFKALVAWTDDPNLEISYSVTRNDRTYNYSYSPIGYAVSNISTHDISLWLASNPRVNVSDELIAGAKKGGMQDVAVVLTKRLADLRRQEAAQFDRDAAAEQGTAVPAALPAAAEPEPAVEANDNDRWIMVAKASVAHVTTMEPLNRKITEIFNFESRERVLITENLKTGAETVGQPEKFATIDAANIQRAEDMMKSLVNGDGAKRTFKL